MPHGRGLQRSLHEVRFFSNASEHVWIWFWTRSLLRGFESEQIYEDQIHWIEQMFYSECTILITTTTTTATTNTTTSTTTTTTTTTTNWQLLLLIIIAIVCYGERFSCHECRAGIHSTWWNDRSVENCLPYQCAWLSTALAQVYFMYPFLRT